MYTKNKLSLSVSVACGALVAGLAQTTLADSLFFPQLTGSQSVTTIVSVINKGTDSVPGVSGDSYPVGGKSTLHYVLYYKNSEAQAYCDKVDRYLPTSQFDIASIDIAGNLTTAAEGGVMFNDPSMLPGRFGNGSDYAMGRGVLPMRGYLMVDNQASANNEETLTGEAFLFDFGSGAAWSYQAFMNDGDDVGAESKEANSEFDYSWAKMRSDVPINFMPLDDFNTGFLVTPTNINLATATAGGWVAENMRPQPRNTFLAQLYLSTRDQFGEEAAIYDRDELPISGAVPVDVVCVGRVPAASLMTAGAYAELVDGGWGNLATRRYAVKDATNPNNPAPTQPKFNETDPSLQTGAVVYKVEYNNPGAVFGGIAIPGTFNTGTLMLPEFDNPLVAP